jgi:hypothetical protein
MSGSILRRTVLVLVVVTLLLPLASADAAPAKRSESGIHAIQIADWSRTLLRSVSELLSFLRPSIEADSWPLPPGQMPDQSREGNGIDPHGAP